MSLIFVVCILFRIASPPMEQGGPLDVGDCVGSEEASMQTPATLMMELHDVNEHVESTHAQDV